MPKPSLPRHTSLESSAPAGELTARPSLFDTKDDFIVRVAPIGMAAIYFGSFSLAPQDTALSRQALFKLSFLNRHFLQPAGLRIDVRRQTAIFSGKITDKNIVMMAEILARQIEGIAKVKDETEVAKTKLSDTEAARAAIRFLFATDQTLRSGVQASVRENRLVLEGEASSAAQKNWAEQLAGLVTPSIASGLTIAASASTAETGKAVIVDDESLQALVLFRLRLVRQTEHLPLRVKANRGVVALQGKIRTETLRQLAENLARATLGLRELRSSLTISA